MEDVAPARGALRAWLPVALYGLAIVAVSSLPARSLPPGGVWRFDKLIHLVEYAILAALLARAFALGPPRLGPWAGGLAAALGAIAFGAADEWHQSFRPGRDASGLDLAADAVGATLAAGAHTFARRPSGGHADTGEARHGDHP